MGAFETAQIKFFKSIFRLCNARLLARESLALEMIFFPSVNYLTPPDWSTELFYWRRDR